MKRLSLLLLLLLLMAACSDEDEKTVPVSAEPDQSEQTSEIDEQQLAEDNKKFKKEAVEYDYIAYFRDEVSKYSKVKFTGTVSQVGKPGNGGIFVLEQDVPNESGGTTKGVMKIENLSIGEPITISEGMTLTVYGVYSGKDDIGAPQIMGMLIEE